MANSHGETALYFPYMRVPQTSWFTQVLLYWDAAASIMPSYLHGNETILDQYTFELARVGLLRFVDPDFLDWETLDAFISALDSQDHPRKGNIQRWTRVHAGKMESVIFNELARRGLARGNGSYDEWWEVEEKTAVLYMSYLAGAMCGSREGFSPVTDSSSSIASLGAPGQDVASQLRQLRYAVIQHALPAPSGLVPPRELISFKEIHYDKLRRLRVYLDGELVDLAIIQDEDVRRVRIDSFVEDTRDQVAELREEMTKRRWPKVVLVGVGGVVGSVLDLAGAVVTGGGALALGIAVASGASTLGGSAVAAAELLKAPRFNQRAPLVYAALAQGLQKST
ncbi:DUF6236 family protein [Streptomyces griseoincarnatus]